MKRYNGETSSRINYDEKQIAPCLSVLTFGDGTTENVDIILSGYSSRTLDTNNVPSPEPSTTTK